MIKFTGFLVRKPGLTHDEYVTHHREVHAPLFASLPSVKRHVRRYVQSYSLQDPLAGFPPSPFDGMAEIWFDDEAGFRAVFEDPEYFKIIRPDEESFIDFQRSQVSMMTECLVIE